MYTNVVISLERPFSTSFWLFTGKYQYQTPLLSNKLPTFSNRGMVGKKARTHNPPFVGGEVISSQRLNHEGGYRKIALEILMTGNRNDILLS